MSEINFDNPDLSGAYNPRQAYGQSKLANLLFTLELQRRLSESGSPVRALSAHPGLAATDLLRSPKPVLRMFIRVVAQDAEAGALPTLFAATQDLPGASYVGPDGISGMRGGPTRVSPTAAASDPAAAKRLWRLSEELTGTSFAVSAP